MFCGYLTLPVLPDPPCGFYDLLLFFCSFSLYNILLSVYVCLKGLCLLGNLLDLFSALSCSGGLPCLPCLFNLCQDRMKKGEGTVYV